ncbi:type 2 periplasmic-binding domain-containing protein [Anatilimnocola aggregata]|uniref:hypothetical protein n=1 Tax=Anatilimnocola aggregata TaxID=2528021 RepID=UPI0011A82262|nr:hypothetical protein [Anatilimnocola aggregata]
MIDLSVRVPRGFSIAAEVNEKYPMDSRASPIEMLEVEALFGTCSSRRKSPVLSAANNPTCPFITRYIGWFTLKIIGKSKPSASGYLNTPQYYYFSTYVNRCSTWASL